MTCPSPDWERTNWPSAGTMPVASSRSSADVNVDISDVTIADGSAYKGGGIYNKGALTITNSTSLETHRRNKAAASGVTARWISPTARSLEMNRCGTKAVASGTMARRAITDSTFSGNSSYDDGGGIWNGGTLDLTNGTFSNNATTGDSGWGLWGGRSGGAIWNGGALDITHGSFLSNSAARHGGGIHNVGGTVTIADSEFTGNSAAGSGATGGAFSSFIHLTGTDGTLAHYGQHFLRKLGQQWSRHLERHAGEYRGQHLFGKHGSRLGRGHFAPCRDHDHHQQQPSR